MLSDEQIRREAVSRIFLSQRSEEEKDRLEAEVLEMFTTPGNDFSPSEMDEYHLLITRLTDCGYIGCGVDRNLEETYKTTDSGRRHLAYLREMLGRTICRIPLPIAMGHRLAHARSTGVSRQGRDWNSRQVPSPLDGSSGRPIRIAHLDHDATQGGIRDARHRAELRVAHAPVV